MRVIHLVLPVTMLLALPVTRDAHAADNAPAPRDSALVTTLEAGDSDVSEPRRKLIKWNEFEGPFFTLRMGGGFLYEAAGYDQNETARQQFDLEPDAGVRDFRFLLKGRIKTRRPTTWTCGIMYDGAADSWHVRETGVIVAVPELWGHVFIGRTKEGFSLNKVMSGYSGWTMERFTMSDASIPILADGVKWLGYIPDRHVIWNLGWFGDALSEGESFSSYDTQVVARVAWLPLVEDDGGRLLHVGMSARYGKADGGDLRLRSRPEAFLSPYFVDTGVFPASSTRMAAVEAYYRPGPLLVGTEYFFQWADAPAAGDPFMHGGDVVVSWLVTGETRAYNTMGGFFKSVSPGRTVFEGGPGAWEAVLRMSYIDLDGGTLSGGKFWRITPMVNWHLSDNVRLELAYGYGQLDRFGVTGTTQFFQSRIQLQL